MPLTPKQERFVDEFLVDLSATQAAIRAGYSRKTANRQGSRMLSNVDISEAIATARKKTPDKFEVTRDNVVRELVKIGFAEIPHPNVSVSDKRLALMDLAKVLDLLVDRKEISAPDAAAGGFLQVEVVEVPADPLDLADEATWERMQRLRKNQLHLGAEGSREAGP